MNTKIAVYICQCGSNISDYVDVNQVKAEIENDKNVVIAKVVMFACADSAQHEIIDDIQTHDLDSIVVASCSPKLHLYTFRDVAVRAGLNPYKYVQVNIREQCSWAHSDNPPKATVKAIKLIRAGIAKAKHSAALKIASISSENTVIVVGAGVTGMSAAIKLAEMGTKVFLIEKDHFVGGRTSQWDKVYPADTTGKELVSRMYSKIFENPNINLLTGTQIISSSGSVGNYQVKVRTTPRNVTSYCSTDWTSINEAIRNCPVEVNDEFNFNLTKRKALYRNHPGQFPELPVIDHYLCRQCEECGKFFTGRDSTQDNEHKLIKAGAIILATGFDPYEPAAGEYEYLNMEQVVTLQQFKRIISDNRGELIYKKRKIQTIAYIYCVGSRQSDGENQYCSRYCCTAALHASLEAGEKFRNIYNYHFTRGIRAYGKQEMIYSDAINKGDVILQFEEDSPPVIYKEGEQLILKVKDILTENMEIEVPADLIVLVTGMVPRQDVQLSKTLKAPKGRDHFYNEVHPKLKPVETVIDGIFIAGTCQGPKNITESIQSANTAATKANILISKGSIELEPIIAVIDQTGCNACGKCTEICPYDAIIISDGDSGKKANIIEAKCKGCGMCLPVCPENSIQLTGFTDVEIESMIEALIS